MTRLLSYFAGPDRSLHPSLTMRDISGAVTVSYNLEICRRAGNTRAKINGKVKIRDGGECRRMEMWGVRLASIRANDARRVSQKERAAATISQSTSSHSFDYLPVGVSETKQHNGVQTRDARGRRVWLLQVLPQPITKERRHHPDIRQR